MLIEQFDCNYCFRFVFDDETRFYLRTGILDENGKGTGIDSFMGFFPHLIDVGIMGHCEHGKTDLCVKAGIGCYQNGLLVQDLNMILGDFIRIVWQCSGRVNQFALGGVIRICTKFLKKSCTVTGRIVLYPTSRPRAMA